MKDYRSLETKIRTVLEGRALPGGWVKLSEKVNYHPVGEIYSYLDDDGQTYYLNKDWGMVEDNTKNTERRKKEPNVGRPGQSDATMLKQNEIRKKIIDEAEKKKFPPPKDKKDAKGSPPKKAGKDDKDKNNKDDDKDSNEFKTSKDAKKFPPPKKDGEDDGKNGKGFPPKGKGDGKPGEDSKSKDLVANSKKENKIADGYDRKDPKELNGGKTEVDTSPTTDDNLTDHTKEKDKGDKEAKKQNKKAGAKSAGPAKDMKEESDLVTEISKELANRYYTKRALATGKDAKSSKSGKGLVLANRKLSGRAKVPATEEFTPEELAHIERVMAEQYVDMTKQSVNKIINAKGKPHKVYTATDETRHGIDLRALMRELGVGDSEYVMKKFMHNLHTIGVRTGWSHSAGKHIAYHGPKI